MSTLIFPGTQLFEETLANPGMFWFRQGQRELSGDCVFIQPVDGGGLLVPATSQQAEEYLWGGEYEEAQNVFDVEPDDDEWFFD
ncbi:MAG: hypothetical protein ACRC78_12665 [Planktothrix sp.]